MSKYKNNGYCWSVNRKEGTYEAHSNTDFRNMQSKNVYLVIKSVYYKLLRGKRAVATIYVLPFSS